MQATLSAGPSTTIIIRDGGRVVSMSSVDPYYRYFRALADLFIANEITEAAFREKMPHDHPEVYACPAARHVVGSIYLAMDEPACLCDPYAPPTPHDCPDPDRRARLKELIGA